MKIDTQRYKANVLAGGEKIVRRAMALRVELFFVPIYEGQLGEMMDRIAGRGFELFAIFPEIIDPETGRTLQINGVFHHTHA
jgi:hypothetical protein